MRLQKLHTFFQSKIVQQQQQGNPISQIDKISETNDPFPIATEKEEAQILTQLDNRKSSQQ
jgi:hypothetical protein